MPERLQVCCLLGDAKEYIQMVGCYTSSGREAGRWRVTAGRARAVVSGGRGTGRWPLLQHAVLRMVRAVLEAIDFVVHADIHPLLGTVDHICSSLRHVTNLAGAVAADIEDMLQDFYPCPSRDSKKRSTEDEDAQNNKKAKMAHNGEDQEEEDEDAHDETKSNGEDDEVSRDVDAHDGAKSNSEEDEVSRDADKSSDEEDGDASDGENSNAKEGEDQNARANDEEGEDQDARDKNRKNMPGNAGKARKKKSTNAIKLLEETLMKTNEYKGSSLLMTQEPPLDEALLAAAPDVVVQAEMRRRPGIAGSAAPDTVVAATSSYRCGGSINSEAHGWDLRRPGQPTIVEKQQRMTTRPRAGRGGDAVSSRDWQRPRRRLQRRRCTTLEAVDSTARCRSGGGGGEEATPSPLRRQYDTSLEADEPTGKLNLKFWQDAGLIELCPTLHQEGDHARHYG
uniref:Uncharacterized protein n=1 Tax=Oryza punctata TaxID=4537 RepID=A0A0E0JVF9_ORYPU